jgi:hypothetical protein
MKQIKSQILELLLRTNKKTHFTSVYHAKLTTSILFFLHK